MQDQMWKQPLYDKPVIIPLVATTTAPEKPRNYAYCSTCSSVQPQTSQPLPEAT